jgi:hypothetical protein
LVRDEGPTDLRTSTPAFFVLLGYGMRHLKAPTDHFLSAPVIPAESVLSKGFDELTSRAQNKRSLMQFEVIGYADISTAYLEKEDLDLLASAPNHLAEIDDGVGTILWVPSEQDLFEEFAQESRQHGLSDRFIEIMSELHQQQIAYVRFDADGGEVDGLEHAQV